MHRNPVKRHLVEKREGWEWRSFRHNASGVEGAIEIESRCTAWHRSQLAHILSSGLAEVESLP